MRVGHRWIWLALSCLGWVVPTAALQGQHDHGTALIDRDPDSDRTTRHQEGLRFNPVTQYAILGATVHRSPGAPAKIETVLVDQGKIVAIGTDLELPPGTRKVDATGQHLYPGLIDAFAEADVSLADGSDTGYWNDNIQPQRRISQLYAGSASDAKKRREAGFTATLVAPSGGILKGQSSLLLNLDEVGPHTILAADVAQHLRLTTSRGRRGYPNSPMGAYALARQALSDAQWYQRAWETAAAQPKIPRPETNVALAELDQAIRGQQMVIIDSSNELYALRADRFAREFGLQAVVLGSGNEYRRLDEVAAAGRTIILPVNFPQPPDVSSPEGARNVSLESMMHWDHAPENPARLASREIPFVFTTLGLKSPGEFLKQVRKAVDRGLDPDTALHAMTMGPATLFGVGDRIGSIEKDKLANFTMTDGDLFREKTKITGVGVEGTLYRFDHKHLRLVAGNWAIRGRVLGGKTLILKEDKQKVSGELALKPPQPKSPGDAENSGEAEEDSQQDEEPTSIELKKVQLSGTRLTGTFDSTALGQPGISLFTFVFLGEESATGQVQFPDGTLVDLTLTPNDEWEKVVNGHQHAAANASEKAAEKDDDDSSAEGTTDDEAVAQSEPAVDEDRDNGASFPVNYPLGAFGRTAAPAQPQSVLIKNVTVWTLDDRGRLENGAILFGGGRVQQVFAEGEALPAAEMVVDGRGGHVTPGLIDCHSHMASDSGINESGQAITAEVRIGDMIDCDDITIYRQLAGGVTSSNILHGSANPIGGQNQVIKLRWGANEEAMKLAGAPAGIKFALGENVKQSNRSEPGNRYPQTRMGVEQIIDDALRAAADYQRSWDRWNKDPQGLPPRRDLELEALAEILAGDRWIHCHSYRQDEILALIRTLDKHEVTIGSFQHILEGYKVADAMAEHGAMASAFADWWAYKYEVKDAIPYAGALMHQAGVVVSYNSDDGELGRRLNQEAVKAVRYGGVPEVEALKFVTLNPARQLRIDDRVGSLEAGKDADLVLWTGHPLSNLSRVQQTWVDGRKYFDRDDDQAQQETQRKQRAQLIQKILGSGEKMVKPNRDSIDPARLWPRYDEFCGHHLHQDDHDHDGGSQQGGHDHD